MPCARQMTTTMSPCASCSCEGAPDDTRGTTRSARGRAIACQDDRSVRFARNATAAAATKQPSEMYTVRLTPVTGNPASISPPTQVAAMIEKLNTLDATDVAMSLASSTCLLTAV